MRVTGTVLKTEGTRKGMGLDSSTHRPKLMETKWLPEFHRLLREATNAARAVDLYDLHSEDPRSKREFQRLVGRELVMSRELIRFCQLHGDEVLTEKNRLSEKDRLSTL